MVDSSPGRHGLRRLLWAVLRTDSDLDAFLIDHFPDVRRRVTATMDRMAKLGLLLELAVESDIIQKLRFFDHEGFAKYESLLFSLSTHEQQLETIRTHLKELILELENIALSEKSTTAIKERIRKLEQELHAGAKLEPGAVIDNRYKLDKIVGKGIFANIWKAFDRKAQKVVAVKVLHSEWNNDQSRVERFVRGAQEMMRLSHPHVVKILSLPSRYECFHYFVMEYVPGTNFAAAIHDHQLSVHHAIDIVIQTGQALHYAHEHGCIHRDVKPHNILLDENRSARLTDFDWVLVAEATGYTRTGVGMGTPNYASPELQHDAKHVDPRSDIYALGMCLVLVLSGKKEFSRSDSRHIDDILRGLKCSEELRQIASRAVAEEPDQRFPTMDAFCKALDSARQRMDTDPTAPPPTELSQEKVPAPPPTRTLADGPTPRPIGTSPHRLIFPAICTVLFATVLVYLFSHKSVQPQHVYLNITSAPAADVVSSDSGKVLGTTPWSASYPQSSNLIKIIIRRDGFNDHPLEFVPTSTASYIVTLVPLVPVRPPELTTESPIADMAQPIFPIPTAPDAGISLPTPKPTKKRPSKPPHSPKRGFQTPDDFVAKDDDIAILKDD